MVDFLTLFCHNHPANQSALLPFFQQIVEVTCEKHSLVMQVLQNNQEVKYLQMVMTQYERQLKCLDQKAQLTRILRAYIQLNILGRCLEDKEQYIKVILTSLLKTYQGLKFPLRLKNMMAQAKESCKVLKSLLEDMGLLGEVAKASILGKAQV